MPWFTTEVFAESLALSEAESSHSRIPMRVLSTASTTCACTGWGDIVEAANRYPPINKGVPNTETVAHATGFVQSICVIAKRQIFFAVSVTNGTSLNRHNNSQYCLRLIQEKLVGKNYAW